MSEYRKEFSRILTAPESWCRLLFLVFPFLGYLSHPTLLLTGIVSVSLGLWLARRLKEKQRFAFSSVDYLVFLLALAFLLSGVLTFDLAAAAEGSVRTLLLLFYFPVVDLFQKKAWLKRGIFALCFSGGIAAFLGIFQYFRGKALLKWVDLSRFSDIGGRVTGGFENPNVFSVYLLLIIPISLVLLFKENEGPLSRFFALVSLCGELLCLIFTWSRGAWLAALLELLLFFLLFSRRTRRWLMIGILPLTILSFYFPHNVVNRFQSIGNLNESSIRYRLFVWKGTWKMICDHPLGIGLGFENFSAHYLPYAVKGTETVIHSHQILLQILCELGLLGLILFLIFLSLLFLNLIRKNRNSQKKSCAWLFSGGLALIGALTAGLFDNIWYHYGVFCLFWSMAALARSSLGIEKSKKEP